jgi:hypothetical protein
MRHYVTSEKIILDSVQNIVFVTASRFDQEHHIASWLGYAIKCRPFMIDRSRDALLIARQNPVVAFYSSATV